MRSQLYVGICARLSMKLPTISDVYDSLKRQLPRRRSPQLVKAYRRGGLEEAAGWMNEKIAFLR
jgi:hypothetical protein